MAPQLVLKNQSLDYLYLNNPPLSAQERMLRLHTHYTVTEEHLAIWITPVLYLEPDVRISLQDTVIHVPLRRLLTTYSRNIAERSASPEDAAAASLLTSLDAATGSTERFLYLWRTSCSIREDRPSDSDTTSGFVSSQTTS